MHSKLIPLPYVHARLSGAGWEEAGDWWSACRWHMHSIPWSMHVGELILPLPDTFSSTNTLEERGGELRE